MDLFGLAVVFERGLSPALLLTPLVLLDLPLSLAADLVLLPASIAVTVSRSQDEEPPPTEAAPPSPDEVEGGSAR